MGGRERGKGRRGKQWKKKKRTAWGGVALTFMAGCIKAGGTLASGLRPAWCLVPKHRRVPCGPWMRRASWELGAGSWEPRAGGLCWLTRAVGSWRQGGRAGGAEGRNSARWDASLTGAGGSPAAAPHTHGQLTGCGAVRAGVLIAQPAGARAYGRSVEAAMTLALAWACLGLGPEPAWLSSVLERRMGRWEVCFGCAGGRSDGHPEQGRRSVARRATSVRGRAGSPSFAPSARTSHLASSGAALPPCQSAPPRAKPRVAPRSPAPAPSPAAQLVRIPRVALTQGTATPSLRRPPCRGCESGESIISRPCAHATTGPVGLSHQMGPMIQERPPPTLMRLKLRHALSAAFRHSWRGCRPAISHLHPRLSTPRNSRETRPQAACSPRGCHKLLARPPATAQLALCLPMKRQLDIVPVTCRLLPRRCRIRPCSRPSVRVP